MVCLVFWFLVVLVFLVEYISDVMVVFLHLFAVYRGLLEEEILLMVVGCYLVQWGCCWVVNRSRYASICQIRIGV